MSRQYDIVLYGATGFTGKLATRYVVQHCATDLKWAVAGRSHPKLAALVEETKQLNVNRKLVDIVIADSSDLAALTTLAKATKVVVSFAGPFATLGDKVVQACAENGTHYVDITGETPWIRRLILKYHEKPAPAPSIIIPSCGFDSLPSDLGTYLLISALQKKYGTVNRVRSSVMELSGSISGGSISSILNLFETIPVKEILETYKSFSLSPIGRPPNGVPQPPVVYDERLGGWIGPWLMSATNAAVVRRTYGLLGGRWGDKFSYREYFTWGSWFYSRVAQIGFASMGALLMLPPVRWLARKFAPSSGEGPDEEAMKNGKFAMKIVADTDSGETGSITMSANCDVGYLLTAMMVVESGLILTKDIEKTEMWKSFFNEGQTQTVLLTPSLMGESLRESLEKGGLHFSLDV